MAKIERNAKFAAFRWVFFDEKKKQDPEKVPEKENKKVKESFLQIIF